MTLQAEEAAGDARAGAFAERRIFVKTESGTRYYRVSTRAQIAVAALVSLAFE